MRRWAVPLLLMAMCATNAFSDMQTVKEMREYDLVAARALQVTGAVGAYFRDYGRLPDSLAQVAPYLAGLDSSSNYNRLPLAVAGRGHVSYTLKKGSLSRCMILGIVGSDTLITIRVVVFKPQQ